MKYLVRLNLYLEAFENPSEKQHATIVSFQNGSLIRENVATKGNIW
jgi:hypothetical protein